MDIDNGWNTPLELAQMAGEVRADVAELLWQAEEEGGGPLGRPGVLDF
jgi:hypothetical protein